MNRRLTVSIPFAALVFLHASVLAGLPSQGEDYAAIRATKRVEALRVDQEAIVVDGHLDEDVWQRAQPADTFYQQAPDEGELATRQTEVRFLYDDTTLYVGAMMYDDQPDGLVINELTRDFNGGQNDTFGLVLDLFRDGQTGYGFLINAGGATRDTQVYDNGRNDPNWHGVWFSNVAILDDGWSAEFAIPFKTLRFPNSDVPEWGMNMVRWSRRINEMSLWSPVLRPQRHYTVSEAGLLTGVQARSSSANFRVKPYALGEVDQLPLEGNGFEANAGVDIKWGLSSSLVLDGTYRTDFSQVEADAQQINLTRFSLFFPEKREFFLESPGSFQIGLTSPGGENRRDFLPFFTRRIGLSERGQPIPVLGGLRLTGRQGPWGIGLMNMQTEDYTVDDVVLQHADNFTAVRMTRDVAPGTTVGGYYFGRESSGEIAYNRVAGVDLLTQPTRSLRIEAFGMKSFTDQIPGGWAGRAGFSYEGNTNRAYFFHLYIGDTFRNGLGFVRREAVALTFARYEKILRPQAMSQWIREHTIGGKVEFYQGSDYGVLESRIANLSYDMSFQDGANISVNFDNDYELLREPFRIYEGIVIPPGQYDFSEVRFGYRSNGSAVLSGDIQYGTGSFWNGTRRSVNTGLRVRLNQHIAVGGTYDRNSVDLVEGDFVTNLGGINLDWSFTPRMFLNAFIQYNSDTDAWLSNIRFNLIHRPLSDIFVVYNETRSRGLASRSLILKYTHMFAF